MTTKAYYHFYDIEANDLWRLGNRTCQVSRRASLPHPPPSLAQHPLIPSSKHLGSCVVLVVMFRLYNPKRNTCVVWVLFFWNRSTTLCTASASSVQIVDSNNLRSIIAVFIRADYFALTSRRGVIMSLRSVCSHIRFFRVKCPHFRFCGVRSVTV